MAKVYVDTHPIQAEEVYRSENNETHYGIAVYIGDHVIKEGWWGEWGPTSNIDNVREEYRHDFDKFLVDSFKGWLERNV